MRLIQSIFQKNPFLHVLAKAQKQLCGNRVIIACLIFISVIIFLCLLSPWIAPYQYHETNLKIGASPPSLKHWFGTDIHGRDLFCRILFGGKISILVSLSATFVSIFIGVSYGLISGYCGGRIDSIMMRFVDVIYPLPFTILIIILTTIFERSLLLVFLAIGAVQWLTMARVIRAQTLALKTSDFVHSAHVLGQKPYKIILKHIFPNLAGIIIVYTTLTIPDIMLLEGFVSFLGVGVQPPMTSWGVLIKEGAEFMEEYPWLILFPSIIFSLTLFSLNFIGDYLRDVFDPKMRSLRNKLN
jgi:oligopeptide transport system permease protein